MAAAAARPGFASLPPETRLEILESLPNVSSLINAVIAVRPLHQAFAAYSSSVSTRVLKRELPPHVWEHALASNMLQSWRVCRHELASTDMGAVASCVAAVRRLRDAAPDARVSLRNALAISRLHKKVTELRDLFVDDCAYAKAQLFFPLWDSVRYRPPMPSELDRIDQALYLFQMLVSLCGNMVFTGPLDGDYLSRCRAKVAQLQTTISEHLMAPWELYHVIAIQSYFRRAIHGFERSPGVSERIMPGILALGTDFLHEALCVVGYANVDKFMAPYEMQALIQPYHALGMIMSRGTHKTWTRTAPRPFNEYAPFSRYKDRLGYGSWRRIEERQAALVGSGQTWADLAYDRLEALEGRLDLWGAALWDESRWADMDPTLRRPEPALWQDMAHHWSPTDVGFQILARPWLLEESLAEEAADGSWRW